MNIWWNHFSNKHIDLETCLPEEDASFTLNTVNFHGFDDVSKSPHNLRYNFV